VLDVTFADDQCRLRKGHGARNMATVRHFALNLVRTATDKRSIKSRRKIAGWDPDYRSHSRLTHRLNWIRSPAGRAQVLRKSCTAAMKAAGASAWSQWPAPGIASMRAAGNSARMRGRASGRT